MDKRDFVSIRFTMKHENRATGEGVISEDWTIGKRKRKLEFIPIHRLVLRVVMKMFMFFASTVAGGDIVVVQSAWDEFLKLANGTTWTEEGEDGEG